MLARMSETRRAGRWRTGQQNKQRIIDVARERFMRDGYDRTTVRAIAADAGVDVAMVYYFFDNKEGLFTTAVLVDAKSPLYDLIALLNESTEDIGARLARHYFEHGDKNGLFEPLLMLWHSATTQPLAQQALRETFADQLAEQVASKFKVTNAKLRIELVATHLSGLAFARYQAKIEPIASTSVDDLVAWIGPTIERYLTAPDPWSPDNG